jgi:glucose-1-phosphate cytidylyltransferase
LDGQEVFMANYSDGLADLDLNIYLENFYKNNKVGCFLSVKPSQSFHVVSSSDDGQVTKIEPVAKSNIWINGGYFVFKKEIFDYIQDGEELVQEPFYRLLEQNQLMTYKNRGFWACIDTLKEKKLFDDMYARGDTPWAVWDKSPRNSLYQKNGNFGNT